MDNPSFEVVYKRENDIMYYSAYFYSRMDMLRFLNVLNNEDFIIGKIYLLRTETLDVTTKYRNMM